jgi:hypothetical protein
MSFWVSAYCHRTVTDVGPKDLLGGIANRLESLEEQFPGDYSAGPGLTIAGVLHQLEIVPATGPKKRFRIDALVYSEGAGPITTVHFDARHNVPGIIEQEVLPGKLARSRRPGANRVRELLAGATESVGFALKVAHYTGIGFPLAVAAAATLVTHAGGILCSGGRCWMVPGGPDGFHVDIILSYD